MYEIQFNEIVDYDDSDLEISDGILTGVRPTLINQIGGCYEIAFDLVRYAAGFPESRHCTRLFRLGNAFQGISPCNIYHPRIYEWPLMSDLSLLPQLMLMYAYVSINK
jgi:hypothetical protein